MTLLDHVNIRQGTASTSRFSAGNTLPLSKRPFGMSAFAPQSSWAPNFFHPADRALDGVRLTHQPSPWVSDFAALLFSPQSGKPYVHRDNIWSGYRPNEAVLTPAYQELDFLRARAKWRLTPTERAAIVLLDFHESVELPRLMIRPMDQDSSLRLDPETLRVEGYTTHSTHPVAEGFKLHFVMDIIGSVDSDATMATNNKNIIESGLESSGEGAGLNIAFGQRQIEIRMAFSFISVEQAWINLDRELGARSFNEVREETEAIWESYLKKIRIKTDDSAVADTFYSAMYRLFLFPNQMDEIDANGRRVHRSAYDGQIHSGPAYTNNGFWDTFRTVYPLYSLICPERYADILEGYVNAYRESGWLPKWPSPAETGIMPGTLIDAVIADAAVKGIGSREMLETALEGAIKHANTDAHDDRIGRRGLTEYLELGYVPKDKFHENVNRSLDYIYGDYCIGLTARALGREDLAEAYFERGMQYKLLYDKDSGFMRGRDSAGKFVEPFDPFSWGGDYTEGSAWQNSLAVYHDVDGLIDLMGGRDAFVAHLDELFATPPFYTIGSYWAEIHEMTEMAAIDFGQFAISNQPSFHIPYLYAHAGERDKAIYWLERATSELFTAEPDGYPGDEDNGSMAGWYIFTMMGLYPICPGKPEYIVTKPLADEFLLTLEDGKEVLISTDEEGRFLLDGKVIDTTYLSHQMLLGQTHA